MINEYYDSIWATLIKSFIVIIYLFIITRIKHPIQLDIMTLLLKKNHHGYNGNAKNRIPGKGIRLSH
ncbi:hypothetical protein AC622_17870 [Bacillus sp. FJAT-27916]|nr:hypothetical protein AC622_17870 [Bacillus sp. FJAT-27916]